MLIYTDTFKPSYFPSGRSHFYERLLLLERGWAGNEEYPVPFKIICILYYTHGVQYIKPAQ